MRYPTSPNQCRSMPGTVRLVDAAKVMQIAATLIPWPSPCLERRDPREEHRERGLFSIFTQLLPHQKRRKMQLITADQEQSAPVANPHLAPRDRAQSDEGIVNARLYGVMSSLS